MQGRKHLPKSEGAQFPMLLDSNRRAHCLGTGRLCQHNFEHNRYLKASSINRKCLVKNINKDRYTLIEHSHTYYEVDIL